MFTACFDASGSESDKSIVVVAGFVSSAKEWQAFSHLWNQRLEKDDISYFHMKEFAQSVGQFKSWDKQEKRRRLLLCDLMSIIKRHAFRKFGCAIAHKKAERISQEHLDEFLLTAYCLCGRQCAADVNSWARMEKITSPIEFVFEDGDKGKGRLMQRFEDDQLPIPIFKPKTDRILSDGRVVPGFTPLQACDFLAYEALLIMKGIEGIKKQSLRWAAIEFQQMPEIMGFYSDDAIDRLNKMLNVSRKTQDWSEKL